jgi:hypothetical protein
MLGSLLKQRMRTLWPRSSQPKASTSSVTMVSSVIPCSGSFDGGAGML